MKTNLYTITIFVVLFLSGNSFTRGQDVTGRNLKLSYYGSSVSEGPFIDLFNKYPYITSTYREEWRFSIDTQNALKILYGYSSSSDSPALTTKFYFYSNGAFVASESLRTPRFLDQDNTNYFLDPANTGISLKVAGTIQALKKIETEDLEVKDLVSATIQTDKLHLNVEQAADYVFEEDYSLLSLTEVENYVRENKHLPEIPAGETMEEEGIDLAILNNLLLRKIEELTLYLIEQDKRIRELEGHFHHTK